ncbi:MAG: AsmA family protein [Deltaproteobacteria bacterium]|nr:AsmA family protein [Deltaproteobacteria bacterium]
MAKFLKITAIVLGAVLVLVILALALAPAFLPLKSMIVDNLQEKTGRPASLQKASLSLLGSPRLELAGLVVTDQPRFGERPLLKMDNLLVKVALWPLFAGKVVVTEARVGGLELSVVRDQKGVLNLATFPAESAAPAGGEATSPEPSHQISAGGDFILTDLTVENSAVYLSNLATGHNATLPLEEFRLSAELAGLTRLDTEAKVNFPGFHLALASGGRAGGEGSLASKGELTLNLQEVGSKLAVLWPELTAGGQVDLKFQSQGPAEQLAVTATLKARDLVVGDPAAKSRSFRLADLNLDLDLLVEEPQGLTKIRRAELISRDAGLEAHMTGQWGLAEAREKTNADYLQKVDLARLAKVMDPLLGKSFQARGQVVKQTHFAGRPHGVLAITGQNRVTDFYLAGGGLPRPFQDPLVVVDYDLALGPERLDLNRMALAAQAAKVNLTGFVAEEGDKDKVDLTLAGEYLDLDRLGLTPQPKPQPPARAVAPAQPAKAQPAAAAPAPPAGGGAAQELRDALADLEAKFQVKLDRVIWGGKPIHEVRMTAQVADGKAQVDKLTCRPLGGELTLAAAVDSKPAQPKGNLELSAKGLKFTRGMFPYLRDLSGVMALPFSDLVGVFDLEDKFTWQGLEEKEIDQSLAGQGRLASQGRVTVGFGFLDELAASQDRWAKEAATLIPTQFESFAADYRAADGKINYEVTLVGDQKEYVSKLEGFTRLADRGIEARLKLAGPVLGRDLTAILGKDGSLPVTLTGTLDHPQARLEISGDLLKPAEKLLRGLFGN